MPAFTNIRKSLHSVITSNCTHRRTCRCLAHVINLTVVDVMSHITKVAAVETTAAIWEYDPSLPSNRIINGSLDVVAAIRTLAIKVNRIVLTTSSSANDDLQIQASNQRIEHFKKLQTECGIDPPLRIPLHSNVRWGTAHGMLTKAYKLREVSFL